MSKLGCGEVIVGGEVRVGIGVGIISGNNGNSGNECNGFR